MIWYKVLDRVQFLNIKVSYDIEVGLVNGHLPTEEELAEVAKKLYSRRHNRTFVYFYLPGMVRDAGAFATGHSTPELEVRMMNFCLPQ